MIQPTTPARRAARFFFMHLGGLVAVFVYFHLYGAAGYSLDGLRHALAVGLAVMTAYVALAYTVGELKQFDVGLWIMFAVGRLATRVGIASLVDLFRLYSSAILFATFAITATVTLVLGPEPFTTHYARRQIPAWQLKLPVTASLNRLLAAWWVLVLAAATVLAAAEPLDWRFTLLYPNLLVFLLGFPSVLWLPPLYLKLFPPALPQAIEALLMGMPFFFDGKAAGDARATIQFRVSGAEAGDYYLRIGGRRCESFEGLAPAADLTVSTADGVWKRIVRGELDGGDALAQGQYSVEGDLTLLARLADWFPARR